MAASFPPMMFSMEELVGVVKLIIQMESAVAQDDDQKNQNFDNEQRQNRINRNGKHKHNKHHKKKDREPPNIQRWISKRSKRDILFLLASISGVKMKIYSLPSSTKLNGRVLRTKPNKFNVCKERVCRVSMDGKYLSMGEDCINLDKRLEISLGVDMCYSNVRVILKQLGLYNYYTNSTFSSSPSDSEQSHHHKYNSSSTSSSIPTDEYIKNARFNHRLNGNNAKLKPKHCITIHDPATARTLILQLSNCSDRTMWAKGLCHLKHLNQKARNFRWTVVAYLISKYANTLNAHSQNNLNHTNKGLKGVTKGLSALKIGFGGSGSSSNNKSHNHYNNNNNNNNKINNNHRSNPMNNTPCYIEPWLQVIKAFGSQNNGGLQHKYPPRYKEMYERRQNRLKNNQSNYEQFGENELMYDPNKVIPKPEDNDIFYE